MHVVIHIEGAAGNIVEVFGLFDSLHDAFKFAHRYGRNFKNDVVTVQDISAVPDLDDQGRPE